MTSHMGRFMSHSEQQQRIARLRALAAQVERLPRSKERDALLLEIRARAVDAETGPAPSSWSPPAREEELTLS